MERTGVAFTLTRPVLPTIALTVEAPSTEPANLDDPALYLNRELTWLAFNNRVLQEAEDERNPLLERLKFLAITSSNLDEFFMKRIGGLKQQVIAGLQQRTVDGRTPTEQISESYAVIDEFEQRQRRVLAHLEQQLKRLGVSIVTYASLTSAERLELRERHLREVFPLLTPQVLDPAHPFPFVSNLSLNPLVAGHSADDNDSVLARIKVPLGNGTTRFVRVGQSYRFVATEDVMANNLDVLFPGMVVESCERFRVTRNANAERDEEQADDLLALIETELRDRRMSPIVRLEIAKGMEPLHRGMIAAELGLDEEIDVVEKDGLLGLRDLMELASIDLAPQHDPPHQPSDHRALPAERNIFHSIRDSGSILLLHPYQSFATTTERFLREASEDPKVRAIKMTLYRTSADARIIELLCDAARNGKQVAVVVELKARFDEAANIAFVRRLEEFGIHVSYGVIGFKTHCKLTLVVRQDFDGLRRYAHIGTGNYHPGTARLYADIGLLTADDDIGHDLTELFNYLTTGYQPRRPYRKILPAPTLLKAALLDKIAREAKLGSKGAIRFKMNALEDPEITRALYEAGAAGVDIQLAIRDTCRIRPGLEGFSKRVRVVSIVGRFLEHARIYHFHNGGADEYFIGSADCMKRNLESRIEVVAPVEDAASRRILSSMLDIQLAPNRDAWEMQPDGSYREVDTKVPGAQQQLIDMVAALALTEPPETRKGKRRFARRSGGKKHH